ncbi:MAG: hypothetical protein LBQ60_04960 [Bacteroidales bacterium]|nr:hypothetical protein [Bacteroidales bacterium]
MAKLSLKNIIALEDDEPIDGGEIPEVEIVCNANGSGRCWDEEHEYSIGIFGLPMCETICTDFNGRTTTICVPGVPC